MAYNKSKNVEAAQKLLNQGKVAQAIAEYQQILKFEPRDQVTADLCRRWLSHEGHRRLQADRQASSRRDPAA